VGLQSPFQHMGSENQTFRILRIFDEGWETTDLGTHSTGVCLRLPNATTASSTNSSMKQR
jgi:hypothetical protein